MQDAPKLFAEIAAIPTISSGQFTQSTDDFEVALTVKKYGENCTKKSTYLQPSRHSPSVIEQVASVKFRSFSPDGSVLLVGISEPGDKKSQLSIEIWENSCFVKSLPLSDIHGEFCLDEVFGSFSWSPSGKRFMYVAEKASQDLKDFQKYAYAEHFGEKLYTVAEPVICVLDFESVKVDVLNLGLSENIFPSQPIFASEDCIYFTGIRVGSKKLGMSYIYCRLSSIYRADISNIDCISSELISDENLSCRSPISSGDGSKIVYLANSLALSHFKCSKLMCYDSSKKSTRILVDIVDEPKCGFPGIFTQRIPEQRFTSKVLMTSCWFNDRPIIEVDVDTGAVERLSPEKDGCFRILHSRGDCFLVVRSTPTNPGEVFIWNSREKSQIDSDLLVLKNNNSLAKLRDSIQYKVIELNQQVNIVLTQPKDTSGPAPLIIVPHGGPNSVYSVDYVLIPSVLAMLGYAVASINYTGSIGFGDRSIKLLEGNIGGRDVEDCYLCTELLLKSMNFDRKRVWLMGGSHGGYLTAFLSAKYPDTFCGAILRNPVIDLPSMLVTSDIADWTFGQLGMSYDQLHGRCPTAEELLLMRERSPSSLYQSVKCPSLIMLGTQDLRVHHTQGLYWGTLLKSAGVDTKVMLFPDANHGLETPNSEKYGFLAIFDFLTKN